MRKGLLVLAVALTMLVPVSASAEPRGHGHVFIGGGFGWGPYWGGYWGPWGPYWGSGWWGPGYYDRYANTGEVKLDTRMNDAQVFIDGALLGTVHDNKTIHLRPGAYKIEIREPGRPPYMANIYVAVGKTLKLRPEG